MPQKKQGLYGPAFSFHVNLKIQITSDRTHIRDEATCTLHSLDILPMSELITCSEFCVCSYVFLKLFSVELPWSHLLFILWYIIFQCSQTRIDLSFPFLAVLLFSHH